MHVTKTHPSGCVLCSVVMAAGRQLRICINSLMLNLRNINRNDLIFIKIFDVSAIHFL